MEKTISMIIACLLALSCLPCFAHLSSSGSLLIGDGDTLNLLWDIEFKRNIAQIRSILERERGIICEYEEHPKSKFLPYYETLDSTNDGDFVLYGYSYHFHYTTYPKIFTLRIPLPDSSWEDRLEACHTILGHLLDKYGTPDHATVELFSDGSYAFVMESCACSTEIIEIPQDSARDFDPDPILEAWPDTKPETELNLRTLHYNMCFLCSLGSRLDDHGYIEITFYDEEAALKAPMRKTVDEPKPTPEPIDPEGF